MSVHEYIVSSHDKNAQLEEREIMIALGKV